MFKAPNLPKFDFDHARISYYFKILEVLKQIKDSPIIITSKFTHADVVEYISQNNLGVNIEQIANALGYNKPNNEVIEAVDQLRKWKWLNIAGDKITMKPTVKIYNKKMNFFRVDLFDEANVKHTQIFKGNEFNTEYLDEKQDYNLDFNLRYLNIDNTTKNLLLNEQKLVKEFFEQVVDEPAFFTNDHKRIRKLILDWYTAHRTIVTKSRRAIDPYSLNSEELNELIMSLGYPYPHEIPANKKAAFLHELINFYQRKGSPQVFLKVLEFYGLSNVVISEWWIERRYDNTLPSIDTTTGDPILLQPNDYTRYVARSQPVVPTSQRNNPEYIKYVDYLEFISRDPLWHLDKNILEDTTSTESIIRLSENLDGSYDTQSENAIEDDTYLGPLSPHYTKPGITLPSLTSIISVNAAINMQEVNKDLSILSRKMQETFEWWVEYELEYKGEIDKVVTTVAQIQELTGPLNMSNFDTTGGWDTTGGEGTTRVLISDQTTDPLLLGFKSEIWSISSSIQRLLPSSSYVVFNKESASHLVFNSEEWIDLLCVLPSHLLLTNPIGPNLSQKHFLDRDMVLNIAPTQLFSFFEIVLAIEFLFRSQVSYDVVDSTTVISSQIYPNIPFIDEPTVYNHYSGRYSPLDKEVEINISQDGIQDIRLYRDNRDDPSNNPSETYDKIRLDYDKFISRIHKDERLYSEEVSAGKPVYKSIRSLRNDALNIFSKSFIAKHFNTTEENYLDAINHEWNSFNSEEQEEILTGNKDWLHPTNRMRYNTNSYLYMYLHMDNWIKAINPELYRILEREIFFSEIEELGNKEVGITKVLRGILQDFEVQIARKGLDGLNNISNIFLGIPLFDKLQNVINFFKPYRARFRSFIVDYTFNNPLEDGVPYEDQLEQVIVDELPSQYAVRRLLHPNPLGKKHLVWLTDTTGELYSEVRFDEQWKAPNDISELRREYADNGLIPFGNDAYVNALNLYGQSVRVGYIVDGDEFSNDYFDDSYTIAEGPYSISRDGVEYPAEGRMVPFNAGLLYPNGSNYNMLGNVISNPPLPTPTIRIGEGGDLVLYMYNFEMPAVGSVEWSVDFNTSEPVYVNMSVYTSHRGRSYYGANFNSIVSDLNNGRRLLLSGTTFDGKSNAINGKFKFTNLVDSRSWSWTNVGGAPVLNGMSLAQIDQDYGLTDTAWWTTGGATLPSSYNQGIKRVLVVISMSRTGINIPSEIWNQNFLQFNGFAIGNVNEDIPDNYQLLNGMWMNYANSFDLYKSHREHISSLVNPEINSDRLNTHLLVPTPPKHIPNLYTIINTFDDRDKDDCSIPPDPDTNYISASNHDFIVEDEYGISFVWEVNDLEEDVSYHFNYNITPYDSNATVNVLLVDQDENVIMVHNGLQGLPVTLDDGLVFTNNADGWTDEVEGVAINAPTGPLSSILLVVNVSGTNIEYGTKKDAFEFSRVLTPQTDIMYRRYDITPASITYNGTLGADSAVTKIYNYRLEPGASYEIEIELENDQTIPGKINTVYISRDGDPDDAFKFFAYGAVPSSVDKKVFTYKFTNVLNNDSVANSDNWITINPEVEQHHYYEMFIGIISTDNTPNNIIEMPNHKVKVSRMIAGQSVVRDSVQNTLLRNEIDKNLTYMGNLIEDYNFNEETANGDGADWRKSLDSNIVFNNSCTLTFTTSPVGRFLGVDQIFDDIKVSCESYIELFALPIPGTTCPINVWVTHTDNPNFFNVNYDPDIHDEVMGRIEVNTIGYYRIPLNAGVINRLVFGWKQNGEQSGVWTIFGIRVVAYKQESRYLDNILMDNELEYEREELGTHWIPSYTPATIPNRIPPYMTAAFGPPSSIVLTDSNLVTPTPSFFHGVCQTFDKVYETGPGTTTIDVLLTKLGGNTTNFINIYLVNQTTGFTHTWTPPVGIFFQSFNTDGIKSIDVPAGIRFNRVVVGIRDEATNNNCVWLVTSMTVSHLVDDINIIPERYYDDIQQSIHLNWNRCQWWDLTKPIGTVNAERGPNLYCLCDGDTNVNPNSSQCLLGGDQDTWFGRPGRCSSVDIINPSTGLPEASGAKRWICSMDEQKFTIEQLVVEYQTKHNLDNALCTDYFYISEVYKFNDLYNDSEDSDNNSLRDITTDLIDVIPYDQITRYMPWELPAVKYIAPIDNGTVNLYDIVETNIPTTTSVENVTGNDKIFTKTYNDLDPLKEYELSLNVNMSLPNDIVANYLRVRIYDGTIGSNLLIEATITNITLVHPGFICQFRFNGTLSTFDHIEHGTITIDTYNKPTTPITKLIVEVSAMNSELIGYILQENEWVLNRRDRSFVLYHNFLKDETTHRVFMESYEEWQTRTS